MRTCELRTGDSILQHNCMHLSMRLSIKKRAFNATSLYRAIGMGLWSLCAVAGTSAYYTRVRGCATRMLVRTHP